MQWLRRGSYLPRQSLHFITAHCPLIQSNTTQCRRISFGGDARWHHLTTGPNIPNHRHTKIWIVEADADVGHVGLCEINEGFNYLPLDGVHPPPATTTTVAIKRMLIGPQSIFNVGDPMQSCVALVSRAQGGGEGGGGGGGRGGAKGVEWVADEPDARGRERGRGEGGGGRGEKKERKKKQKTVAGRHVQTGQREKRKRSALIGSRSPHAPPPSLATSSGADEVPGRAPRYSTSKRCSTAPLSFVLATHAASSVIMAARWSGRRALGAAAGSGGRSKGFYHLTHHSIIYRPVSSIYAAAGVVTQHIDR